ncbi:hypothetical protein H0H92_012742 [Tricholoma furcatifolium]|nr:hypothetical protein H0H92_012742 [Tricholoma furcatifolium]
MSQLSNFEAMNKSYVSASQSCSLIKRSPSQAFVLLWATLKVVSRHTINHKPWRRFLGDTVFQFVAGSWNIRQFQYFAGTSVQIYEAWARRNSLPVLVDRIGGGYAVPIQYFTATFWNHVRLEYEREGLKFGFAIMSYSLIPTVKFPTQLVQAVEVLQHVIESGCSPENIHIVSDSAGGNLALALLSHMLHPIPSVPRLISCRLGSLYTMSPWVSLTGDTGSHLENDSLDIVPAKSFGVFGRLMLEDIPSSSSLQVYLEASKAPNTWFKGVDELVGRILVTAGGVECLRDDIVQVADRLSAHHPEVKLIVQKHGVHNDPFFDFFVGTTVLCDLTPKIMSWLRESLTKSGD